MDPNNTSPEGQAPTTPATPAAVFGDESAPTWVKETGLLDAHRAGNKPATPPAAPTGQSAASAQPPAAPAAQPGQPAATTPVEGQPPAAPAAQPPAPAAVDPTAIARAVAEGIRTGQQPQPQGPSTEELSKQLGIVTVTPEMYKGLFGVDGTPEQVKQLNDFGQAIAKQAVTIASVMMQQNLSQLQSSLAPYTEAVRTQEAQRQRDIFFTENADLKGYEELVRQQYQLALKSGQTFPTVDAARKYVADQTRTMLKSLGINPAAQPTAGNGTNQPGKSTPQTRPMAPTSMGGRSGGNDPATQQKTTVQKVWGE